MARLLIEVVPVTASTNSDLLDRIRSGARVSEGDWLIADRQTSGRGRQGRVWCDGLGNFMGSTVVRLGESNPPVASLALMAGVAVYAALEASIVDMTSVTLKWPNDVMKGAAKLAGILLEREGDTVVAGFGINLKQAPDGVDGQAVAVAQFSRAPDRDDFAQRLTVSFANELGRWRVFGLNALKRRWLGCAHPLGTPLSAHDRDGVLYSGTFDGLTHDGSLRMRLAEGQTHVMQAGEVMLLDSDNQESGRDDAASD